MPFTIEGVLINQRPKHTPIHASSIFPKRAPIGAWPLAIAPRTAAPTGIAHWGTTQGTRNAQLNTTWGHRVGGWAGRYTTNPVYTPNMDVYT